MPGPAPTAEELATAGTAAAPPSSAEDLPTCTRNSKVRHHDERMKDTLAPLQAPERAIFHKGNSPNKHLFCRLPQKCCRIPTHTCLGSFAASSAPYLPFSALSFVKLSVLSPPLNWSIIFFHLHLLLVQLSQYLIAVPSPRSADAFTSHSPIARFEGSKADQEKQARQAAFTALFQTL